MKTGCSHRSVFSSPVFLGLAAALWFGGPGWVRAEARLLSVVPGRETPGIMCVAGVAPNAPVVFTFSEPMDTVATLVQFRDLSSVPITEYSATAQWTDQSTVLTCTPAPAFPSCKLLTWSLSGQSSGGETVSGSGAFKTGRDGTGPNTNGIMEYIQGWTGFYRQTSSDPPVPDASVPYAFRAAVSACSNYLITAVTYELPNRTISLPNHLPSTWDYYVSRGEADWATLTNQFPDGGEYQFKPTGTEGHVVPQYGFGFLPGMPSAPHINNFEALQAVDPSQPFVISWDRPQRPLLLLGHIRVEIGDDFQTPGIREVGGLSGTNRSIVIPAGTLKPGSNYTARVSFYDGVLLGGALDLAWLSYKASTTEFNLFTGGGTPAAPMISNPGWANGRFSFEVQPAPDQSVTVLSSGDPALPLSQWNILWTTNSLGARVLVEDTGGPTNRARFYRVMNGP